MVQALERQFAIVELRDVSVHLFPRFRLSGAGLLLGREADTPFLSVRSFFIQARTLSLLRRKKRIEQVNVEGMEATVLPTFHETASSQNSPASFGFLNLLIENIISTNSRIVIPRRDSEPLSIDIPNLQLTSVGLGEQIHYDLNVDSPVLPGTVEIRGALGPITLSNIAKASIAGHFGMVNGDRHVVPNFSGAISAEGNFTGTFEHIDVTGSLDAPTLTVRSNAHPLDIRVEFDLGIQPRHASAELRRIRTAFRNTVLILRGQATRSTVTVQVESEQARAEDLFALMLDGEPPLEGAAELHAHLELPPGTGGVRKRLRLLGTFALEKATFRDASITQKLVELSARASGRTPDHSSNGKTQSDFTGYLTLENGRATFSRLLFFVPGATVNLHGAVDLRTETLDLRGMLNTHAPLSRMAGGFKSVVGRLVQPLFRTRTGNGQTEVPIKITGTRAQPKFGLDTGRLLRPASSRSARWLE